jgi:hypothetical protein
VEEEEEPPVAVGRDPVEGPLHPLHDLALREQVRPVLEAVESLGEAELRAEIAASGDRSRGVAAAAQRLGEELQGGGHPAVVVHPVAQGVEAGKERHVGRERPRCLDHGLPEERGGGGGPGVDAGRRAGPVAIRGEVVGAEGVEDQEDDVGRFLAVHRSGRHDLGVRPHGEAAGQVHRLLGMRSEAEHRLPGKRGQVDFAFVPSPGVTGLEPPLEEDPLGAASPDRHREVDGGVGARLQAEGEAQARAGLRIHRALDREAGNGEPGAAHVRVEVDLEAAPDARGQPVGGGATGEGPQATKLDLEPEAAGELQAQPADRSPPPRMGGHVEAVDAPSLHRVLGRESQPGPVRIVLAGSGPEQLEVRPGHGRREPQLQYLHGRGVHGHRALEARMFPGDPQPSAISLARDRQKVGALPGGELPVVGQVPGSDFLLVEKIGFLQQERRILLDQRDRGLAARRAGRRATGPERQDDHQARRRRQTARHAECPGTPALLVLRARAIV